MNRILRRFFVALLAIALAAALPAAAQEVISVTGSANQVGKLLPRAGQTGGAQVSLAGKFTFGGTVDLCTAGATITDLLHDAVLGELVRGTDGVAFLPVELLVASCVDKAISVTENRARPSARVVVVQKSPGVYDFNLKIKRANIPAAPQACSDGAATAPLDFRFVLDDGVNDPVAVAMTATWRCQGSQLRTSFSVPVPTFIPPPTPTAVPTATPTPVGAPTPPPTATPNVGVLIDLTGHATRLEEAGAPSSTAQIRMSGRFCAGPALDLTTVPVTIGQLLDESGTGELVQGLPINLAAVAGGIATKQQYRSVGPTGPSTWMQIQQNDVCTLPGGAAGTRYELNLKVDRTQDSRRVPITYVSAPACDDGESITIATSFTVGGPAPIEVLAELPSRCSGTPSTVLEIGTE